MQTERDWPLLAQGLREIAQDKQRGSCVEGRGRTDLVEEWMTAGRRHPSRINSRPRR